MQEKVKYECRGEGKSNRWSEGSALTVDRFPLYLAAKFVFEVVCSTANDAFADAAKDGTHHSVEKAGRYHRPRR